MAKICGGRLVGVWGLGDANRVVLVQMTTTVEDLREMGESSKGANDGMTHHGLGPAFSALLQNGSKKTRGGNRPKGCSAHTAKACARSKVAHSRCEHASAA